VDAQINRSVVASDRFGVSGRAMLAALVAGERDPKLPAQLARARLRANLGPLEEGVQRVGHRPARFLLAEMLGRVDQLDADLAELDAELAELIAGFAGAVERLDEIPGLGQTAAQLLLAELGPDMTRFPTAGHLVSWARFAPASASRPATPRAAGRPGAAPVAGAGARRGRRGRQQDRSLPW
jgi:transposase